jgi:hypothetical protein
MAISKLSKILNPDTLETEQRAARISNAKSGGIKSSSWNYFSVQEPSTNSCIITTVDIPEILDSLKKDGFSLGINLPSELISEIWTFANRTLCYGNNDPSLGFYYSEKEQAQTKYGSIFKMGDYYKKTSLCPVIKQLGNDPILLKIAARYLDSEAVHQGNQLRWNFPLESPIHEPGQSPQMFHREGNKRRVLKFLFYITDVDLCSNPHVCVRGSHIKKELFKKELSPVYRRREYSYQEITEYYGYQNIVPICGRAGLGFVEDMRCFHRKASPGSKDRLTLQIKFGVKD